MAQSKLTPIFRSGYGGSFDGVTDARARESARGGVDTLAGVMSRTSLLRVTLPRLGAGFLTALAAATLLVGLLADVQVRWARLWQLGDWVLLRGVLIAAAYASSVAATEFRFVRSADWPVLRLTGQDVGLWAGLYVPCLARAALVWAAGVPVSMPRSWRVGTADWVTGESLCLPVGLALGLALHTAFWVVKRRPWLANAFGGLFTASMVIPVFLGMSPLFVPETARGLFHKAAAYPVPAVALTVSLIGLLAAGFIIAFRSADERFAVDHLAVGKATPVGGRGGRRSRPVRSARPVREWIVREARPHVWKTAGLIAFFAAFFAAVVVFGLGPAAAAAMKSTSLRIAMLICALATAAVITLTPLVCLEAAVTQRWSSDVALTRPLAKTLAEVRSAGWRTAALPLIGLVLSGAAYLWLGETNWTSAAVVGGSVAAVLLGWVGQFGMTVLSLTPRSPAERGVLTVLVFLLPPLMLPLLASRYRRTVRAAEAEPASVDRDGGAR